MPIKGLQKNGQTPGLARAGVIRLGYKARKCTKCARITEPLDNGPTCPKCNTALPTDKSFPRESPFFLLTDAPGVAEAIKNPAPTELKVFFPFDEVDRVFPNYMQLWSASSLLCRGDGEIIVHAINPQTGRATVRDGIVLEEFSEARRTFVPGEVLACPGLDRNLYPKCAKCKPNAMLIVMLRDVPRLAYYQISTTSIHNIVDLTQQLDYVREQVAKLTGQPRIAGVPFILRRVKRTVSAPKTDRDGNQTGRQRVEKYFLELEIEPEWISRMVRGISRLADPLRAVAALPAPQSEPLPVATMPASHFTEPPQWEPRPDDEPVESEWEETEPETDPGPVKPEAETLAGWASLDDFLYQLHQDFGLSEAEAKTMLKELGYKGFPKNGAAKPQSVEMYRAVERRIAQLKSEAEAVGETGDAIEGEIIEAEQPTLTTLDIFFPPQQTTGYEE